MKRLLAFLLIVLSFTLTEIVSAYEVETHELLSKQALSQSVLASDAAVLAGLGLESLSQKFQNSEQEQRTIIELVQDGSKFEDDLPGSRFFHHFYDLYHNLPLTDYTSLDQLGSSILFGGWLADPIRSPDWALEDQQEVEVQEYSFKEARRYLFDALTLPNAPDRNSKFGLTFQTLGHVIHHIQDMAQPQHTHNEQHPFLPRAWYEQYTKARSNLPLTGYSPVQFATTRQFWTGDGKGIGRLLQREFCHSRTQFCP